MMKPEKLTKWDGWIYWQEIDGYFPSVDDLLEYCRDDGITPPKWVHVCKEEKHRISIDGALDNMIDDAYDGAADHLVDVDELYEFIEKWNKKQRIVSYFPDRRRVLLLEGGEK